MAPIGLQFDIIQTEREREGGSDDVSEGLEGGSGKRTGKAVMERGERRKRAEEGVREGATVRRRESGGKLQGRYPEKGTGQYTVYSAQKNAHP